MKVIFIKPNMIAGVPGDAMEPLVFGILSSLTPPEVERKLFDERIEAINVEESADLVAITTDTFSAKRAYQIAALYREKGIPVVMGGFHPSLCPDEVANHADVVAIGDAEDTWPRIIDDLRSSCLKSRYTSQFPGFGDHAPDMSVFSGKKYGPIHLTEYNRGCRFACDFCSIRSMYGGKIRRRAINSLLSEIGQNGRRHVFFTDDNIFSDKKSFRDILHGLNGMNIHWSCQISTDVALSPDLVSMMATSGCSSVTIGLESLNADNLAQMRKAWMGTDQRSALRSFQQHGIMVYGTFVIGYDHDTTDVFDEILEFAIDSKLFLANFNPLTPTPGTPLYDRLNSEGRLLFDNWWLHPDYRYGDCVFEPKQMTAEQVRDGCFYARQEFNRFRSLASRFPGVAYRRMSPYQAGLFLTANLVSKREIYRKQGRPLGSPSTKRQFAPPEERDLVCISHS